MKTANLIKSMNLTHLTPWIGLPLLGASLNTLAQERPNIIYIMTDQHTASAMSCAGSPYVNTPNLDRLAQRGIRFTNAYCAFPLSGPSRAAMFTGYTPAEIGMHTNGAPMPDSLLTQTLGNRMAEAGYSCAYAGKWHVPTAELPDRVAFGFEKLHGHDDYGLAEACVRFLQRKHKQPFFLVASFDNPHNICEVARTQNPPFAQLTDTTTACCPGLPANFMPGPYEPDALAFEKRQNHRLYPTTNYTPDQWRHYLYAYYRLVERVDAEIGKLIDELDRQQLWKHSVIIFTADHGDGCAAHQWNQKTALYEEVVNVPFILCLPGGKQAGKELPTLINNGTDLMPSLLDWAGAPRAEGRTGASLKPIAEKGLTAADALHPYVVTETNFLQTAGTLGWMVRTPRYKYVLYDTGRYREQLFDMENDRGEQRNLAVEERYAEVLARHRRMLCEWAELHPSSSTRLMKKYIPNNSQYSSTHTLSTR